MDKPLTLGRVCLTYTLCGAITLQPVLANVTVDGSSGNTSVTQAGNGVEVINIATPNSQGLSHNKYQQFNVDPSGLILNNSTETLAQSQLGGILQGNGNLNGQAASVILNEVTGANRSQLQGYTEVFGQQANVILANPYGITCNGCGFINTPRLTLSTGAPQIDNGLVSGFEVAQGSVTIEGLGLDATNQTYFDIISRTAEINANIHANDLSIVTGANHVAYQTNVATAKTPDASNAPTLAIDSSSLGGMYAGRISLVATEAGVGVNVGNLNTTSGDIVLTADGKIQLSNAVSQKSMSLTSGENIRLEQNVIAKKDIDVVSREAIHVSNATVKAGVTGDVSARFAADAKTLSVQGSEIVAQGNLATQVSSLSVDSNSSIGALNINLEGIETASVSGEIAASNALIVKGDDIAVQGEGLLFAKRADFDATNLQLNSEVRTNTFVANVDNAVNLAANAVVKASDGFKSDSQSYHQAGNVLSNHMVELSAETVELGGTTEAKSVKLSATSLVQNGQVLADGNVQIDSQRVEIDGKVVANKSVDIASIDTHVSGTIQAQHDAIITSQQAVNIGNGAKIQAVNTTQVETSLLHNQGAVAANEVITIRTDNYVHDGDFGGEAAININTNELSVENDITVEGPLDISVNSDLSLTKNIHSNDRLQIRANNLTNSGNFSSDGSIALNLVGSFDNSVDGMVVGDSVQIDATHASNSGVFQSLNNMGLNANSLTNLGGIYSFGDMVAKISGNINNPGMLYSEGSLTLLANTVVNSNEIFAKGSIYVAKDMAGSKSSSLTNVSGLIQSREGNIEISTGLLRNERKYIAENKQETKDYRSSIPSGGSENIVIDYLSPYAPDYEEYEVMRGGGRGENRREETYLRIVGESDLSFKAYETKGSLNYSGRASQIVAGENVVISANDVVNKASLIHGKNTDISANSLTNTGYSSTSETTYFDYELGLTFYAVHWYGDIDSPEFEYSLVRVRKVNNGGGEVLNSTIAASNDLDINVKSRVNNSVIGKKTSQSLQNKNKTPLLIDSAATLGAVDLQVYAHNGVSFPDYFLPSNPNGLFVFSTKPNSQYVIETNPLLTNMGQYLGSDYFQQSVGYEPESDVQFLGDAFYDTRIITQAIFEQTGQRYLNNQIGSDLSQMRQLIDAAVEQKASLNLQAGVALSQEQVAKLTNDIVWYEPILVDGKEVLAPKLYIANITDRDFNNGAVIAGSNVTIDTGNIVNSGSITSDDTLLLTSDQQIINDTGKLQAGGDLIAESKGNIENLSGSISGDNVALVSHEGDIINKTLSDQLNIDKDGNILESGKGASFTITSIGDTAAIQANNELVVNAGASIENTGATIQAGKSATVIAGEDIVSTSIENKDYLTYEIGRATIEKAKTDYKDSAISSGAELTVVAGGDFTASGGKITAKDALNISVAGDMNLLANETYELDRYDVARKKDIYSKTRQQGTTLDSDGDLNIRVGGNALLVASELESAGDMLIDAEGQVVALAANETDYSRVYRESKSLFGKSSSDTEISTTRAKGTQFNSGGDLTIVSRGDQAHQASELVAQDNIHLESEQGSIAFVAAEENHSYRHETVSSGLMVKMEGEGETLSTQKLTSIQAGGDVSIAGALGIDVDYVSTEGSLARTLNELPSGEQYAWMAALKDNPDVNWNEVNEAFDSWSYSEQSLSGPAAAIIAIALTVATAGAASGAGAALASTAGVSGTVAGSTVAAMGTAATSTLITQASLSFINNGGDLGATLDDLGSSDKIKVLATAMVTAGALAGFDVMTGVTDGTVNVDTGLPNYTSVDMSKLASGNTNIGTPWQSLSPDAIMQQVGRSGIQAGVDSAINGTDFADGFVNSLRGGLANNVGAIAANQIGDWGVDWRLQEGGFTKALLHGVSQGTVAELAGGDFAAGAAAGVASEFAGGVLGSEQADLSEKIQVDFAGLIGATAGVIATGDAEGAYTGQSVGGIVHRFNHLNHREKVELELTKKQCIGGSAEACNRRDELNRLDYERNEAMQTACSVGSPEECQSQIELARANYDSYEGQVTPFDDAGIGRARNGILVYLNDPDGSKRAADQEFINNAPGNIVTGVAGVCTVLSYGACATTFSLAEILIEGVSVDHSNVMEDFAASKPIVGGLGLGLSETIRTLPGVGATGKTVLDTLNFLHGYGYDKFVDNIEDNESNE